MAATVTVTGVIGPAQSLTSAVYSNVTFVDFDCVNNVLIIAQSTTTLVTRIAITSATTITATKSGSTYTFTIS